MGDFWLVCPNCGYESEKNAAQKSTCPDCFEGLRILTVTKTDI